MIIVYPDCTLNVCELAPLCHVALDHPALDPQVFEAPWLLAQVSCVSSENVVDPVLSEAPLVHPSVVHESLVQPPLEDQALFHPALKPTDYSTYRTTTKSKSMNRSPRYRF